MASRAATVRAGDILGAAARPLGRPADPNILCLRQARDLLRSIDDAAFTAATPLLPGGSPGKHLRHCLDFYLAFFRGLRTRRVDYSHRRRQVELETSREAALAALSGIERRLALLAAADLDLPLAVRSEENDGEESVEIWCRSSVHRELQSLLSHTIHHYALMGVVLRTRGFEPPRSFGVSPSTLSHWGTGALRGI
jgi:DinB family protein